MRRDSKLRRITAHNLPATPAIPLSRWTWPPLTRKRPPSNPRRPLAAKPAKLVTPARTRPVVSHDRKTKSRPPRPSVPIVAITGTAGKTSTKGMLVSILKQHFRTVTTPGNDNLGSALAGVFTNAQRVRAQAIVLEMGMERRGQIAAQCRYAAPDIGIITNVNHGHLTHCGGFAGVIKAKNEMVYGVRPHGTLILNADDPGTKLLNLSTFQGKIIRHGKGKQAAYRLLQIMKHRPYMVISVWAEGAKRYFAIPAIGYHHAYNAMAALIAARCLGVPWRAIQRGLKRFVGARGRLTPIKGVKGTLVLDDSFNANPLSVVAGLKTLVQESSGRPTVAVLGNMEEQGVHWQTAHQIVGRAAVRLGINYLITVGQKAAVIAQTALHAGMARWRVVAYPTLQTALHQLTKRIPPGSLILVKGSHSTHLGKVVKMLARSA